jgi:hypothetical protein
MLKQRSCHRNPLNWNAGIWLCQGACNYNAAEQSCKIWDFYLNYRLISILWVWWFKSKSRFLESQVCFQSSRRRISSNEFTRKVLICCGKTTTLCVMRTLNK